MPISNLPAIQTQAALHTSVFHSLEEQIAVIDRSGNILDVNKAWLDFGALNNLPSDYACTGHNYLDTLFKSAGSGDTLAGEALRGIEDVLAGKRLVFYFEYPCHSPDEKRWFTMRVTALHGDESGELFVISHHNITQRKLAEMALRIAAITFESQNGTIVTNMHGYIMKVNSAFTRLTGYTADEVIGKTPSTLQSGRHEKQFYEQLWSSLRCNGYWQGEIWNRRKNGEIYPQWLSITAVYSPEGAVEHYVGTFHDITEQKRTQELLQHMAHHDTLTGLPNRALVADRLQQAMAVARRENHHIALMFIDLDMFKQVNDELGHEIGDVLLKDASKRLSECVRESDTVGRIGGDEFVVLLPAIDGESAVSQIAEKIRLALCQPFHLSGQVLAISASIGVSIYPTHGNNEVQLMKMADVAMYRAKKEGGNSFVICTEIIKEKVPVKKECM